MLGLSRFLQRNATLNRLASSRNQFDSGVQFLFTVLCCDATQRATTCSVISGFQTHHSSNKYHLLVACRLPLDAAWCWVCEIVPVGHVCRSGDAIQQLDVRLMGSAPLPPHVFPPTYQTTISRFNVRKEITRQETEPQKRKNTEQIRTEKIR